MSKSHKEIHKKNPLARNWQRLLDIRHFLRNKFPFLDFSSLQSPHKDAGNGLRCIFHIIKSLQTSWTGRISHTHTQDKTTSRKKSTVLGLASYLKLNQKKFSRLVRSRNLTTFFFLSILVSPPPSPPSTVSPFHFLPVWWDTCMHVIYADVGGKCFSCSQLFF